MKIKLLLISLLAVCATSLRAQEPAHGGGIEGQAVSRVGRAALNGVRVTLQPGGIVRYTDAGGRFSFGNLPEGQYTVKFESYDFEDAEVNVRVARNVREVTVPMISTVSTGGLNELDIVDFDVQGSDDVQYSSSNLSASKDLFSNIAGYKFSEMRFNMRGLRNENIFLNGIEFNDALTGYSPWSLWTGLNDATRNQEVQSGIAPMSYGIGGLNGNTNINARASQMRKGFRGSVAGGTNSYLLRIMLTYASGMLDNGWSYAFSVSTRQGRHAWVDGVYYNTWGWFASVEKRFNSRHNLSLTAFGTPTQRGAQAAATDEVYTLMQSNYYNPNWGYQDGKIRNARVRNNHEPVVMLNYTFKPTDRIILNAAAAYRFGRNGYSALDWFNAADPRPDYYRNLPSYIARNIAGNENKWESNVAEWWSRDPQFTQINWAKLYDANRQEQKFGVIPAGFEGKYRSSYIIEERRTDQNDLNFRLNIEHQLAPKSHLTYGASYRWNRTEYFKIVKDLLGGNYYIDLDNFADRDFPDAVESQNDLARPNRAVTEGDKYGYDYYAHIRKGKAWAIYNFTAARFSAYAAAEAGYTSFWREGRVEKGLFPNTDAAGNPVPQRLTSLGTSEKLGFFTYTGKVGGTFNISGAHNLAVNVAYANEAPFFDNAFVSPRTRNEVNPGLTTEKTFAAELIYNMRYSWMKFRLSGYYMQLRDLSNVLNFYDDSRSSFTNFAMTGINQRHMGIEAAIQVPIAYGISFEGAMNVGEYIYTSNPKVTQTVDNSAQTFLSNEPVYYTNLYVEGTPQFAANMGLSYRSGNNWFAGIDLNVYDGMRISMNPLYRTMSAFENMFGRADEPTLIANMMAQETFPTAFVVNANVGKLWYLKKGQLGFNFELKNLLNNQTIKTGGYEQTRLWKMTATTADPNPVWNRFDSKYYYLYGINFYFNVYYRF